MQEKGRVILERGYIVERAGGVLAFNRPQAGDEVWLVVPSNLLAAFQQAVQNIANVSANDCLGPDFVNIKSPRELSARRASEVAETGQVLDLNVMVTEVHPATGLAIANPDVSLTLTADDADSSATLYAQPCDLGPRQQYILQAQTTCFGGVGQ